MADNLVKIIAKYAGACEKCGKELRQGWDVFLNKDTKGIVCTKCAKESPETSQPQVDIGKILAKFSQEEIDSDASLQKMQADYEAAKKTRPVTSEDIWATREAIEGIRLAMVALREAVENSNAAMMTLIDSGNKTVIATIIETAKNKKADK